MFKQWKMAQTLNICAKFAENQEISMSVTKEWIYKPKNQQTWLITIAPGEGERFLNTR